MKFNVDDYILVNNEKEWISIQKILFGLGYSWCDFTTEILSNNYGFPDYIMIEIHNNYEREKMMFSYGHIPYENSNIINASDILNKYRENKLERICK